MISGANITPHKARVNATEQVRENLEAAIYSYQQEPCTLLMEEMLTAFDAAKDLRPDLDWKEWVKRNYKITLQ